MSRTIKAIKLLHILRDTINNDDKYIKMSYLVENLDIDDRNIRRIVKQLNDSIDLNIISRTGREGGYRLASNIYNYFFGISDEDLNVLELTKKNLLRSNSLTSNDIKTIEVINKITNYVEIEEEYEEDIYSSYDEDEFIIL